MLKRTQRPHDRSGALRKQTVPPTKSLAQHLGANCNHDLAKIHGLCRLKTCNLLADPTRHDGRPGRLPHR
eukprot:4713597-Lingulodinium_polyedra.AAC.1